MASNAKFYLVHIMFVLYMIGCNWRVAQSLLLEPINLASDNKKDYPKLWEDHTNCLFYYSPFHYIFLHTTGKYIEERSFIASFVGVWKLWMWQRPHSDWFFAELCIVILMFTDNPVMELNILLSRQSIRSIKIFQQET